jgi:hypothetical protein
MTRAAWVFAATSVLGLAIAISFYVRNRSLEAQLAEARAAKPTPTTVDKAAARSADPWTGSTRAAGPARTASGPAPTLPEQKEESRLERRQRRQQEMAALLGRLDGETEEEWRNRIVPLIKGGLLIPRQRVEAMRKEIEEKAGVTPEQSKKLDQAFEKVYADAIDYTNKAVADGLLSPYERNVAGWLEVAGGMGTILNDAQSQIGQILSPGQMQTISQSGFEWGEYLGLKAPWEKLSAPPPRPR